MNAVSPIRDKLKVASVKNKAREMGIEPYMLVLLGLNTGLRIGDLLTLKVRDIVDRDYIMRREMKTGKQTEIRLNPKVLAELRTLIPKGWDKSRYLFQSPQTYEGKKPITRNTAYRWVNEACRRAGVTEPVGCHTLRKTFGFHNYQQFKDVASLMMHFNHSEERVTLRYIGITQEMINDKMSKFSL